MQLHDYNQKFVIKCRQTTQNGPAKVSLPLEAKALVETDHENEGEYDCEANIRQATLEKRSSAAARTGNNRDDAGADGASDIEVVVPHCQDRRNEDAACHA